MGHEQPQGLAAEGAAQGVLCLRHCCHEEALDGLTLRDAQGQGKGNQSWHLS